MAKEIAIKIAKGILYVLSRLFVLIIVGVLIYIAFQASMATMNVNMIVKDAMGQRAEAILTPAGDGSDQEMMNKLFTQRAQQLDTLMNQNVYDNFDIYNFYHRTDIDTHVVWPWTDRVTITATDMVMDITGEYLNEDAEEEVGAVTEQSDDDPKPPKWPNGIYEISLVNQNGDWKINSIQLKERVDNPVQTVTPPPEGTSGQDADESGSLEPDASEVVTGGPSAS